MDVDIEKQLPYKAEYAKSGRASCKKCSCPIKNEELRMSIRTQSRHFDGLQDNWHHLLCFFSKVKKTVSPEEIGRLSNLRWEDQTKVKKMCQDKTKSTLGGHGTGDAEVDSLLAQFAIEYSKSGGAICRTCDSKIGKKLVRVGVMETEDDRARMYGEYFRWRHLKCFAKDRAEFGFTLDLQPAMLKGFKDLEKEDRDEVLALLGKGDTSKPLKSNKRNRAESSDISKKKHKGGKENSEEMPEEDSILEKQSKLLWAITDMLKTFVSKSAYGGLLEFNKQEIPSGESRMLERLTDAMVFGPLTPCPDCKGQLVYSDTFNAYKCIGHISEYSKCEYFTQTPPRGKFKIPKEYLDCKCLKDFRFVPRKRVFPQKRGLSPKKSAGTSSSPVKTVDSSKPLNLIKVCLTPGAAKVDAANTLKALGATVVAGTRAKAKIDGSIVAVVATDSEFEKPHAFVEAAKRAGVHVVQPSFVDHFSAQTVTYNDDDEHTSVIVRAVEQHVHADCCEWAVDVSARVVLCKHALRGGKSGAALKSTSGKKSSDFLKSTATNQKVIVKNGVAIDTECDVADITHVYQEHKRIYSAVLNSTDLQSGRNSYYRLQLLERDGSKPAKWWVFRAWGRIGTTIGGTKLEDFYNLYEAKTNFEELFEDKSGNVFGEPFVKLPGKMNLTEMSHDVGEDIKVEKSNKQKNSAKSKLAPAVQNLMKLIFDIDNMKQSLKEFELDTTKMPLGKLSTNQLKKAYSVLTDIQKVLRPGDGDPVLAESSRRNRLMDLTNRFYTLLPHDFGVAVPPLIDSEDVVKAKCDMIDNLVELEIAYRLLKTSDGDEGTAAIDKHYDQLKTKIVPLERDSDKFKLVEEYAKNTHAATHNTYSLEVLNVYEIEREGEHKRFKAHADKERKLLWHGSRLTNYAGILSQGLRIAPPEAPSTGYMFGKGVYFADMISKSANYCWATKQASTGLLTLADVAVGEPWPLSSAKMVTKLPDGKDSVLGLGMTEPDPKKIKQIEVEEGKCEVPLGKPLKAKRKGVSLLYNEYVVYDVSQIRMRYLVETNFKYKY